MHDEHQLATPSSQADLPARRFVTNPRSLRPGQLLLMDKQGRRPSTLTWIGMIVQEFGLFLGLGVLFAIVITPMGITGWPAFLTIWGGTMGVITGLRRGTRPLYRAMRALTAGDISEAERVLTREPRRWNRRARALRARLQGYVADARGRLSDAVEHYDDSIRLVIEPADRVMMQAALVDALARSGDLERARSIRAAMKVPTNADSLKVLVMHADLTLAIVAGDARGLDEDTVHDWVRTALEHNHTRGELLRLARILTARGDVELAEHCLRESRERFWWCSFEQKWPEMHRWVEERLAMLEEHEQTEKPERAEGPCDPK